MKAGYLSEFFTGVATKTLSAVEADFARSNQHEYNGNRELIRVFGRATEKHVFPAKFIYLTDEEDGPVAEDATVTWYDSRLRHRTRTEHRLYFPTTRVSLRASEGDLLVIGRRPDNSVLVVIAQGDSTTANQIRWLFSMQASLYEGFTVREELDTEQDRIQFASTFILEQLGIVVEPATECHLDVMLARFGGVFPKTREFSAFARSTLPEVHAQDDPDVALMAWMERRKSRVGLALENHLEVVFTQNQLRYGRTVATEGKAKPDFLFPGGKEYQDAGFDAALLTMLGVKSTSKERWRPVLAEARRIGDKHLLTLETAISRDQTNQMREFRLQLVVPRKLHATYVPEQARELLDVAAFTRLVRDRQEEMR